MDLALGVAVAGPIARLALIESGPGGSGVIDESIVDLADDPVSRLTETVAGTNRSLADQYHRLVSTRLCWSDERRANQLRRALDDSGVQNVVVVPESQAATALQTSSLTLAVPDDPDFAIARGAAMAAGAATGRLAYPVGDATMAAPAAPDATMVAPAAPDATMAAYAVPDATMTASAAPMTQGFTSDDALTRDAHAATDSGGQLAYSMENDQSEMLPMEYGGDGEDDDELDAAAPPVGRALLLGSTVGGILVAGVAALAVAVTIGVRPTAASKPQPPAPAQQKSVPGNFVPALPAPNPQPAPEVVAPVPALAPQYVPNYGPVGGGAPAQGPPPVPALPPDAGPPVAPPPPAVIPIPIPIPFPNPSSTGGTTTGGTTGTTTGGTTGTTTGGTTGTTTGGTTGTTTGGTTGTTTGGTTGTTTGTSTGTATTGGTTGTTTGSTRAQRRAAPRELRPARARRVGPPELLPAVPRALRRAAPRELRPARALPPTAPRPPELRAPRPEARPAVGPPEVRRAAAVLRALPMAVRPPEKLRAAQPAAPPAVLGPAEA